MRLDRIEREEEVIVDVINCLAQPELNDTAMACKTVDVSEYGMRVTTDMDLPVSTILGLRLETPAQLFRLEGEVRWASVSGEYQVGVLLKDDSEDISDWVKMFQLDF